MISLNTATVSVLVFSILFKSAWSQSNSTSNPPSGWYIDRIGNATLAFDDSNVDNEIILEYNISSSREPIITIFEEDCSTEVPETIVGVETVTQPTNNSMFDRLSVSLDIKQDTISNSSIFTDSLQTGTIDMCVRVDIMHDYDGDNTTDSISYHETNLAVTVDMRQGFNISVLVEREVAQQENQTTELQYNLTACQCTSDFTCLDEPETLTQNEELNTCVFSFSPNVKIDSVFSLTLTQDNMEVSSIKDGVANGLTTVELGSDGTSVIITTQLISAFFAADDPSNIVLDGTTVLSFGDTSGRKLRGIVKTNHVRGLEQSTEGKGSFSLELEVEGSGTEDVQDRSAAFTIHNMQMFLFTAFSLLAGMLL